MRRGIGVLVMIATAALIVAPLPASHAARPHFKRCGHMTVRLKLPGARRQHVKIWVLRGRVRCRTARRVTRYAWRHPSRRGNKALGNPRHWYCVAARYTQHDYAGSCRRRRDGAVVTAFRRSYGPGE